MNETTKEEERLKAVAAGLKVWLREHDVMLEGYLEEVCCDIHGKAVIYMWSNHPEGSQLPSLVHEFGETFP